MSLMPTRWIPYVKALVHIVCLLPFYRLIHDYQSGVLAQMADPVNQITHFTGDWALGLLLLILAVTSPAFVMRGMGGKTWRGVDWLVYVAAWAGVIHYWWLVKKGVQAPMPFTVVLVVLLLARIVWTAMNRAKKAKPAVRP